MTRKSLSPARRIGKIAAVLFGAVLLLALTAVLGFIGYMMLPVSDYYAASERAFVIPGLQENFVPQGLCYDEARDLFLISGYSSEKEASPVYFVNRTSGEQVKRVLLHKANGEEFTGHSGGIAVHGDYVYIAGGSGRCLYVYAYGDLLAAEDGGSVLRLGKVSFKHSDDDYLGSSFVTVDGDRIIVGEYYYPPEYPALDAHQVTTAGGETHGAYAAAFSFSSAHEFGVDPTPLCVYSIREKVQGMCFADGRIYLSTSYGLSHSYLYAYAAASVEQAGEAELLGTRVPLYVLDTPSLVGAYKIAPMSEEIVMLDGRLYVMCESASGKYFFGRLIGGKWCYAANLQKMKAE